MILLMLKLLLAHFIGDFILQPNHWVNDKLKKKWKSKYLYWHIGVHFLLLLILLQFKHLGMVIIIIITHYAIDLGKLMLINDKNRLWLFVVDQVLHLLVITCIIYWHQLIPTK